MTLLAQSPLIPTKYDQFGVGFLMMIGVLGSVIITDGTVIVTGDKGSIIGKIGSTVGGMIGGGSITNIGFDGWLSLVGLSSNFDILSSIITGCLVERGLATLMMLSTVKCGWFFVLSSSFKLVVVGNCPVVELFDKTVVVNPDITTGLLVTVKLLVVVGTKID